MSVVVVSRGSHNSSAVLPCYDLLYFTASNSYTAAAVMFEIRMWFVYHIYETSKLEKSLSVGFACSISLQQHSDA